MSIWLGYTLDVLIYGALGLLLGALVRSELPGFFLIIMTSLMDAYLQLPVENLLANDPCVTVLPSYGPMQATVSGGFDHSIAVVSELTSLEWFAGFAILALTLFWIHIRLPRAHLRSGPTVGGHVGSLNQSARILTGAGQQERVIDR